MYVPGGEHCIRVLIVSKLVEPSVNIFEEIKTLC